MNTYLSTVSNKWGGPNKRAEFNITYSNLKYIECG